MSETVKNRDYRHEHALRMKRKKRLICDIDKEKAETFHAMLKDENKTYTEWINDRINEYLKEA